MDFFNHCYYLHNIHYLQFAGKPTCRHSNIWFMQNGITNYNILRMFIEFNISTCIKEKSFEYKLKVDGNQNVKSNVGFFHYKRA